MKKKQDPLKNLYTKFTLKNIHKTTMYTCLLSILIILITIERYSITTKIFLQPYNFLRLHEFLQLGIFTLTSIMIYFFMFKDVSSNFEISKTKRGAIITTIFFFGIFLTVLGNTIHEISSFFFKTYCPLSGSPVNLCAGLFFNDYYLGRILYFFGALACNLTIITLEIQKPVKRLTNKDNYIITANATVYALGLLTYITFDKVIVGILFVLISAISTNVLLFTSKKPMKSLPFTSYYAIAYSLATIASLTLKYH